MCAYGEFLPPPWVVVKLLVCIWYGFTTTPPSKNKKGQVPVLGRPHLFPARNPPKSASVRFRSSGEACRRSLCRSAQQKPPSPPSACWSPICGPSPRCAKASSRSSRRPSRGGSSARGSTTTAPPSPAGTGIGCSAADWIARRLACVFVWRSKGDPLASAHLRDRYGP